MKFELALVMPVYNEESCIVAVIGSWYDELMRLGIDFLMIVLNDGSCDGTAERLAFFAGNERIRVVNKPNSGHGPTILRGYQMGVDLAEWVFQTDSDDEMKAWYFKELWSHRQDYDALFGFRQGRDQAAGRSFISYVSRKTVSIAFGRGIKDVNTPYRLMRSRILKEIITRIPDGTFAPNIIISGEFAASGAHIYNQAVPHEGRKTGSVSIVKWKLWKAVCKSFLQTVNYRLLQFTKSQK